VPLSPLVGKQRASFWRATHRVNIWEGSVRSSKTVGSLVRWAQYCVIDGPAGNLVMVGKTERTIKRNCIEPLIEFFGRANVTPNYGEGEVVIFGRKVYLAGANDERASDRIRGMTLAGAYVDEVSIIPESFFAMLLTRLSVKGAKLFGTTNPDSPSHWLMRDYLKRATTWLRHDGSIVTSPEFADMDLARFSFNLRDNPTLDPDYVRALAASFSGLWRKRFIEGLWVLAEGAIFESFDADIGGRHVVEELPPILDFVVALDYGTMNPLHALLLGLGTDERIYVCREWRHDGRASNRQMTDAEYDKALRRWLTDIDPVSNIAMPERLAGARTPSKVIVDPSAASFIAQLWRSSWGPSKANNAVGDGIRSTASLFAADKLRVHASCEHLIAEIGGYVWDPKAAAQGVEQPLKVDDHGPDALRYGVMGTRLWWRTWLAVDFDDPTDPDE
jgi:PBSX family phage terminase large subunit